MHKPIIINPFWILAIVLLDWLIAPYLPVHAFPVQEAFINFIIQIAIMIVAAVISAALAPKPKPPKPASITDFELPTAEEGREIPVIFGTVWITGPNVLWFGALRSAPIKKKGGKI